MVRVAICLLTIRLPFAINKYPSSETFTDPGYRPLYEEKNVDFIDAYHAAWMRARSIDVAHTFDRRHFNRFEHVTTEVPA